MGDARRQMRRQDVYDLTQKYRHGDFNKPTDFNVLTPIKENGVHSFHNATSRDLVKGCFVYVEHAYLNGVSYGEAQSRIISNTYCLHCIDLPEGVYNDQAVRVCSATPAGRTGTAFSDDFFFAPVQNAEGASYAVLEAGKSWLTGVADDKLFDSTELDIYNIYDASLPEVFENGEIYSYCLLHRVKNKTTVSDAPIRWWNLDGTEIWDGKTAVKSREISVGNGLRVKYGGEASRSEDDIIALLDWSGLAVCASADEAATSLTDLAPEVKDSTRFKVRQLLIEKPLCYQILPGTDCAAIQSGIYFEPSTYLVTDSETGEESVVGIDRDADGENLLLTNHIRGGRSISVDPAPSPCGHFSCCENAYVAEINWGGFYVDETQILGLNLGYHLALQTQEKKNNDGSIESVVSLDEHGKATLEWTGFGVGRVEPQPDGTWFYDEPFLVKRLNFCSDCFSVVDEPALDGARFELSDSMKAEIAYGINVYLERTEELFKNAKRLTIGDGLNCERADEPCEDEDAESPKEVRIDWTGVRYVNGDADFLGVARKMRFSSAFDLSFKDDVASISISQTTLEGLKGEKGDKGDPGPPGPPGADGLKGKDGKDFTFDDFTPEQLEALKGEPGKDGEDGKDFTFDDFTPEQLDGLKGEDGKDFTFDDFTPEQLKALKGEPGKDGEDGKDADWSTLHIGDAVRKPKLRKPVATGVVDSKPLLSELGEPDTVDVVSYVGEFSESDAISGYESPPTADVLGDVTLVDKTVVTGVSLGLADEASDGAIAVVVAVECADGSVVETTRYLSLNVTTETVRIVSARKYQKGVLTGLGTPKTSNAVTHTNGPAYETVVTGYANVKTAELNVEEVVVDAETANCVGLPETHADRDKIGTEILGDEGGETDANS